jgi:hypothetical protein
MRRPAEVLVVAIAGTREPWWVRRLLVTRGLFGRLHGTRHCGSIPAAVHLAELLVPHRRQRQLDDSGVDESVIPIHRLIDRYLAVGVWG